MSDTPPPKASRTAVCEEHGLRYDPMVHEGCIRCRPSVPGAGGNPAQTSLEEHIRRGRLFAGGWIAGMVAVSIVIATRVSAGDGTMAKGERGDFDLPEATGPQKGRGMVDPAPYQRQIESIDAAMDAPRTDNRLLGDAIMSLGTELAERVGPSRVAGTRLMQLGQGLPYDPDGRRTEWRRVRDENFLLVPWFRNGPPVPPDGAAAGGAQPHHDDFE